VRLGQRRGRFNIPLATVAIVVASPSTTIGSPALKPVVDSTESDVAVAETAVVSV
jgi:hypothetical protein